MVITSRDNKILKLIKSIYASKEPDKFIIEGENFVKDIPNDIKIYAYVVSASASNTVLKDNNLQKFVVEDDKLLPLLKTTSPQGVLAICYKKTTDVSYLKALTNPVILLLDRIQDPGNMGTLIRSAKAFGVDCILTTKGSVDIYNDKVIRSSAGGILDIPIIQGLDEHIAVDLLKTYNIKIIATSPHTDTFHYELNVSENLCIVLGNESKGISEEILKMSDMCVKIPMKSMESLNVSIAGSIILHELCKNNL